MGLGPELFARMLRDRGGSGRNDVYFVHRTLGIAFRIPIGWSFSTERDFEQVKAGQILDADAEVAWQVLAETGLPFATVSRDGLSADSHAFTPGIALFVSKTLSSSLGFNQLEELDESDLFQSRSILKGFRQQGPSMKLVLSDCPAILQSATFVFEHTRMRPTPVRMQSLTIDASDRFFTIRMYDGTESDSNDRIEYRPFIESILIR